MKYASTGGVTRVDFALEDAPVTALAFTADCADFAPDFCRVTIELRGPEGPVLDRVTLTGYRIKKDGTTGRVPAEQQYRMHKDGLWPDPPEYVQELADAALARVRRASLDAVRETLMAEYAAARLELPPTVSPTAGTSVIREALAGEAGYRRGLARALAIMGVDPADLAPTDSVHHSQ